MVNCRACACLLSLGGLALALFSARKSRKKEKDSNASKTGGIL